MSKPKDMLHDESVLAERNRSNYLKRMKKNKYWKRGYKSGKKKTGKQENPYKLSPDALEILRKRTLWEMGYDEAAFTPSKKRLKAEAKQRHEHKHKHKRKH